MTHIRTWSSLCLSIIFLACKKHVTRNAPSESHAACLCICQDALEIHKTRPSVLHRPLLRPFPAQERLRPVYEFLSGRTCAFPMPFLLGGTVEEGAASPCRGSEVDTEQTKISAIIFENQKHLAVSILQNLNVRRLLACIAGVAFGLGARRRCSDMMSPALVL